VTHPYRQPAERVAEPPWKPHVGQLVAVTDGKYTSREGIVRKVETRGAYTFVDVDLFAQTAVDDTDIGAIKTTTTVVHLSVFDNQLRPM
jgi:hypothetical protein